MKFADGTTWDAAALFAMAMAGTEGADVLQAYDTNDALNGLGGSDTLNGGAGNDTLDGGAGDDDLTGGYGSDTYLFNRGGGHDTIHNSDSGTDKTDQVRFGDGVLSSDIAVARDGRNLTLTISETGDRVTIDYFFYDDRYAVNQVVFADGTVWTMADIKAMVLVGTANADSLEGDDGANVISGLGGDDTLSGSNGSDQLSGGTGKDDLSGGNDDDVLDGGAGNDTLSGGDGSDTYLFSRGGGHDKVSNYDTGTGKTDQIQFGAGVLVSDVIVARNGHNLTLTIADTGDTMTVESFFYGDRYVIDQVAFADGTVWSLASRPKSLQSHTTPSTMRSAA